MYMCIYMCVTVCEVVLNAPNSDCVIRVHMHLNGRKFLVRILRLTTVYTHTHTHILLYTTHRHAYTGIDSDVVLSQKC